MFEFCYTVSTVVFFFYPETKRWKNKFTKTMIKLDVSMTVISWQIRFAPVEFLAKTQIYFNIDLLNTNPSALKPLQGSQYYDLVVNYDIRVRNTLLWPTCTTTENLPSRYYYNAEVSMRDFKKSLYPNTIITFSIRYSLSAVTLYYCYTKFIYYFQSSRV